MKRKGAYSPSFFVFTTKLLHNIAIVLKMEWFLQRIKMMRKRVSNLP